MPATQYKNLLWVIHYRKLMFPFLVFLSWLNYKYFKCQKGGRTMSFAVLWEEIGNSTIEGSIQDE